MQISKKIRYMQQGGSKLSRIRERLARAAKVGVATIELDMLAQKWILEAGGKPSFKMVKGYKWATCICVNECIVHGVPNNYKLQKGDLVTIDVGMFYRGYHTDTATTIVVDGKEQDNFLQVGREALNKAIQQATAGRRVGNISSTMQKVVESAGYNVARSLVGHGIGRKLHEDPQIPCFLEGEVEATEELKAGMTLAVEVIYMEGDYRLKLDKQDGWTIRTRDGARSAMFEHTLVVTVAAPLVLTA